MIKGPVNKILLCGLIMSIALLLYHFNEFDLYFVKSPHSTELGTSYGLPSLHSVEKYKWLDSTATDEEWEDEQVQKERVFRFIDGTVERVNLYSYHQNLLDSSKSEMILCAKDPLDGYVPHCVTRKGPSKILDSYLKERYSEICAIPSVRKVNHVKIFFESLFDYRFDDDFFAVEYADMFCLNFIGIEVGRYDNYMVDRLLKTLYDLKDEMKDAW